MENYKINHEYFKLFLKISVYINERFSLLWTDFIYFKVIWIYKYLILHNKNHNIILESSKFSCDYFFSLITSKSVKFQSNNFLDMICKDFEWLINNTIHTLWNPFYFMLITCLVQSKEDYLNFYEKIFLVINKNIINLPEEKFNKFTLSNTVNYIIMLFNLSSISRRKNKMLKLPQFKKIVEEFIIFLREKPFIFSQKAYKYPYSDKNSDKNHFKIILDMIYEILLDIDINLFYEIFSLKFLKGNNFNNKINIGNDQKNLNDYNNSESIEFKGILQESENSIFFYMDIIYVICKPDKNNEKQKIIFERIEKNKKYDKDLESRDTIRFIFPLYTQYFLAKSLVIYMYSKKKEMCKPECSIFGENKRKILKNIISVLLGDYKGIMANHQTIMQVYSLHLDRTKISSSSKYINKQLENDLSGILFVYLNLFDIYFFVKIKNF